MSKIISLFAYIFAVLCVFLVVAVFIGNHFFAEKFVELTGIRISPVYTGGPVNRIISRKGYEIRIHTPVFQGLFSERSTGYVQIDYIGNDIPVIISDMIDYDDDGKTDLEFSYNTKTKEKGLLKKDRRVVALRTVAAIDDGYAVRIDLEK